MRRNFIKEIDQTKKKLILRERDNTDEEKSILLTRQLFVIKEISKYIDSYVWLKSKGMCNRLEEIRRADYDVDYLINIGYTPDSLSSFLRRVNIILKEKIGDTTISELLRGEWKNALVQFRVLSGQYVLSDYLLDEILSDLPDAKYTPYRLWECKEEIEFIYKFSKVNYAVEKEGISLEKLAFLNYVLTKDTQKYARDKNDMILLLRGQSVDYNTFMQRLEKRETTEGVV